MRKHLWAAGAAGMALAIDAALRRVDMVKSKPSTSGCMLCRSPSQVECLQAIQPARSNKCLKESDITHAVPT